ncbi:PI-stichotoxin-Hcr2i-like isoform X2 [Leptopilina boulardi]|uniref:PI-stichotoxin-Hcr2i-like isoform X2 n=1 Tax=Leptopilina boulardi TaxID=63433 RepID=UPI0021F5664C|nr:PI-stichotoxin-Hcr2i-like isoform X2 [Leptopilina boulardi]
MFLNLWLIFSVFYVFLNKNIFLKAENSVCSEPMKTGVCKAAFYRYAYDKTEDRCIQFIYGGCQGNGNNFDTLNECLKACKPTCLQSLQTGKCRGSIPRFGFSSEENKCVQFIYGGCDANENNFPTLKECQSQCEVEDKAPKIVLDN